MATFYASLVDPISLEASISVANGVMTIVDNSNYLINNTVGCQSGKFLDYRKIKITKPNGTQYVLSSLGDGDASILPAGDYSISEEDPITDTYNFGVGDGVYSVTLITVPTFTPQKYIVGTCVYFNGNIYKLLEQLTPPYTFAPNLDPKWLLIDEDDVPVQFRTTENIAVTCCIESCLTDLILAAVCGQNAFTCAEYESICENPNIQKAISIDLDIKAISSLVDNEDWNRVKEVINHAISLCSNCL